MIHLAAQTLQSFFLGGGAAREHALTRSTASRCSRRCCTRRRCGSSRESASSPSRNPAAILSPGTTAERPGGADGSRRSSGPTAVIGAEGRPGGWTILGELRAPDVEPPKDRDFALFLGPWVETDFVAQSHNGSSSFDWDAARRPRGRRTRSCGLATSSRRPRCSRTELDAAPFELAVDGLGVLHGRLARPPARDRASSCRRTRCGGSARARSTSLVAHLEGLRDLPPLRVVDRAELAALGSPPPGGARRRRRGAGGGLREALASGCRSRIRAMFARVPGPSNYVAAVAQLAAAGVNAFGPAG